MKRIKLGVSPCLLGERVRYDGGHKLDLFLRDVLGRVAQYVPVCPEVECGLPVPREPMHLEGDPKSPRLIANWSRRDMTAQMLEWSKRRVRELDLENLDGFIFKSGSPASGMEGVMICSAAGTWSRTGVGLFAREFMSRFPLAPVVDEIKLRDPAIRENFIERIFSCGGKIFRPSRNEISRK